MIYFIFGENPTKKHPQIFRDLRLVNLKTNCYGLKMGVLDLKTRCLLIRETLQTTAEDLDLLQSDGEEENSNNSHQNRCYPINRKSRRKNYGLHEIKRGKGVRQKRRTENLSFLHSLVDTLELEEIDDDYVDNNMTAFGELFIDPTKMQVWSQFVSMSEAQQQNYLDNVQRCNSNGKLSKGKVQDLYDTDKHNPNFEKLSKKIKDFLCSDKLSKESLVEFEEDFVATMMDSPFAVLVLNMPSSYERLLIHGLCHYMQLKATTHKFKRKCLMEIESEVTPFQPPNQLLSDYLETLRAV